jgi:UDP-glucose 4-epimerase
MVVFLERTAEVGEDKKITIRDRTVLVTGGTGSFGSFIVPELLKQDVREVVVFSRDEEKQLDMRRRITDERLRFVIGDVRDRDSVLDALNVDIVFHAAALKVIPTCESFPVENFKTNVLGTWNVKSACIKNGVKQAVLISSDKAVKPVNAYGMAKALAEKVWLNNHDGKFCAVRYGNVIGSRGSVIPFFKNLIAEKKPLLITDPKMTRFLITLQQAINLVFYATMHMRGGEIFVPDIPAANILTVAQAMADNDYPLETVGVRSGEKIHECLISEEEYPRAEGRVGVDDGIYVVHPYGSHANCLSSEFTSANARQLSISETRNLLKEAGF